MKEFLTALMIVLACGIACGAEPAAWFGDGPQPAAAQPAAQPTTEGELAGLATVSVSDSLSFRDRRKMGLTLANVARVMRAAQKDGRLDGLTRPEIAAVVMGDMMQENPRAFADVGDVAMDWDAILEFIERLIELIMRIIPLFS